MSLKEQTYYGMSEGDWGRIYCVNTCVKHRGMFLVGL